MRGSRIEELRAEGLVVEGDYSTVNTVSVSQNGESYPLAVRPQYLSDRNETVFLPLGSVTQNSDEADDPKSSRYHQERIWRAEEMHGHQVMEQGRTYTV